MLNKISFFRTTNDLLYIDDSGHGPLILSDSEPPRFPLDIHELPQYNENLTILPKEGIQLPDFMFVQNSLFILVKHGLFFDLCKDDLIVRSEHSVNFLNSSMFQKYSLCDLKWDTSDSTKMGWIDVLESCFYTSKSVFLDHSGGPKIIDSDLKYVNDFDLFNAIFGQSVLRPLLPSKLKIKLPSVPAFFQFGSSTFLREDIAEQFTSGNFRGVAPTTLRCEVQKDDLIL
ncbi:hypothetical protein [Ascidiaceihabitans sp.]|uniref:hypothetical protein n=1 Tax=Ascidiaceihabitans sp. TaxID=1872644 RepID=UPI003299AFE5